MKYNKDRNYRFKCWKYLDNRVYFIATLYRKKYLFFEYDIEKDTAYEMYGEKAIVSDKHKEEIKEAINKFNRDLEDAHNNYICANFEKANFKIYYKRIKNTLNYDYFLELNKDSAMYESDYKETYIERSETEAFRKRLNFFKNEELGDYYSIISNNPIYLSAKENGERLLELRTKDLFSYLSKGENKELEKLMNKPFLKRLGEKYNMYYAINPKEIDYKLLWNSDIIIWHKPYFAMPGHTRDYYGINPHTKNGVDAVLKDSKPISFEEFLKLYEEDDDES